jgi:hypothetical protein
MYAAPTTLAKVHFIGLPPESVAVPQVSVAKAGVGGKF